MQKKHYIDPDLERDPLHITAGILQGPADGLNPTAGTREAPRRLNGRQGPAVARGRRTCRPDSSQGLATYFLERCPPVSWSGGFEYSNFWSVTGTFSWLKTHGVTPDVCRAMVDLYFVRLGNRTPNKPYCWDFKGSAQRLLLAVRDTGAASRPEDYENWDTQVTEGQAQEFEDSWKDW